MNLQDYQELNERIRDRVLQAQKEANLAISNQEPDIASVWLTKAEAYLDCREILLDYAEESRGNRK